MTKLDNGKYRLDSKDDKILRMLGDDGRVRKSDIAAMIGISDTAVANRIARLVESGVIIRFTVDVNYDLVEEDDK